MKAALLRLLGAHPAMLSKIVIALLKLDNKIYDWLGTLSKLLAAGPHPKHNLTAYHEFFLSNLAEGQSVLDVGCGKGELLIDMATKTKGRAVGVEIDANNAKIAASSAQRSGQAIEVIQADIWHASLRGPFDVVTMSNVLEHLTNRPGLLRHIAHTIQPGKFLIRVPMFDRDWVVAYKRHMGVEYRLDSTHETEYTLEQFQQEMEQAGLRMISHYVRWGELYAIVTRVPQ